MRRTGLALLLLGQVVLALAEREDEVLLLRAGLQLGGLERLALMLPGLQQWEPGPASTKRWLGLG